MFVVFTWAVNNLLTAQVKTLLDQIDQCRSSSKDLTAKNKQTLGRRSGHAHDTERRSEHLQKELHGFELDEPALETEVRARAGALEESKRRLDEAKENLKKSKHQFEQFKSDQLGVLNAHQSKKEAAREEAESFRQHAQNLDDSLRGKIRDENRINQANRDAKGKERDFQEKRAEHEAKVDEYNRAMAHQESTLKEGEDAVRQITLRIAEDNTLSQVARDKQVQVSKKILTMLLELRNLNRFQKMSEASDESHLDAQLADASKNFQDFAVKFKKIYNYLSSLIGEEGRVRTGKEGCNYVKHILKNVVIAVTGGWVLHASSAWSGFVVRAWRPRCRRFCGHEKKCDAAGWAWQMVLVKALVVCDAQLGRTQKFSLSNVQAVQMWVVIRCLQCPAWAESTANMFILRFFAVFLRH